MYVSVLSHVCACFLAAAIVVCRSEVVFLVATRGPPRPLEPASPTEASMAAVAMATAVAVRAADMNVAERRSLVADTLSLNTPHPAIAAEVHVHVQCRYNSD